MKIGRRGWLIVLGVLVVLWVYGKIVGPPSIAALPTLAVLPSLTWTPAPTASWTPTATGTPSATITDTAPPTVTHTPTSTPTATATLSLEDQARAVMQTSLGSLYPIERVSVIDIGSPKLLAMDYPMPEDFSGYRPDFAGHQMLAMACALIQNGFDSDWQFQFSAMINIVHKATGKMDRIDGLSIRITSSKTAGLNCSNTDFIDPQLAADDYILDPVMSQ